MMDNLLAESDAFPKETAMPASPAFGRELSRHGRAGRGFSEARSRRQRLPLEAHAKPF